VRFTVTEKGIVRPRAADGTSTKRKKRGPSRDSRRNLTRKRNGLTVKNSSAKYSLLNGLG